MAIPNSRQTLIDYCLRELGSPVININVATEQVDDRVDQALQMFAENHYDATNDTWIAYSLTQTDVDNGYITLPDDILYVTDVLPINDYQESGIFSYNYQVALQNISPFAQMDTTNYYMSVMNIDATSQIVNPEESFDHYRHSNKLYLRSRDISSLGVGFGIVFRAHVIVDPETYTKIYNDNWLKKYTTALIKKQWGQNLGKFNEVQLLGGVTVKGDEIFTQAKEDIEKLEEELTEKYSETVGFIIG